MKETKTAIILGSGLHQIVDDIVVEKERSYDEIPGFQPCKVPGHQGRMVIGTLESKPVVCCLGRPHWYEGRSGDEFLAFIKMLKKEGVDSLIVTHCSGAINPDFEPGAMMLVNDHINWQFKNPLMGVVEPDGSHFLNMDQVYDPEMREQLKLAANKIGLSLKEGVYLGVQGPCFETPAEVRALRVLGADTVAMSSIPEIITARYLGLRVAMVSLIVNQGAGMSATNLSHEHTLAMAKEHDARLAQLLRTYFT